MYKESVLDLIVKRWQVYAMPVFDMLERTMVKRFNFPPGIGLRLIVRSAYVGENHFCILWAEQSVLVKRRQIYTFGLCKFIKLSFHASIFK